MINVNTLQLQQGILKDIPEINMKKGDILVIYVNYFATYQVNLRKHIESKHKEVYPSDECDYAATASQKTKRE